ncbi:MAG: hypothetical protein PF444_10025, partial [Bacteroidales bacterium]|nr:hypothetical protein [Bacteroidales bacterium]
DQQRIKAAMISDTSSSDTMASVFKASPIVVVQKPQIDQHEIYFVINDTLLYSDLNDFMSEDAQGLYVHYEKAAESFDSTAIAVADKRILYSRIVNSDEKASLIADIMTLESVSYDLEEKRDKLLLASRRLEVETIRANGGYIKAKPQAIETPVKREVVEDKHVSPWEMSLPTVAKQEVSTPFFYNKALYTYYDQIFSARSIEKLVEANQMKVKAGNQQFLADYVMREYNKPVPEETFFEKLFSYDTTLTAQLSQAEIIAKVKTISADGAILFVEANYLSFYTLEGQNVLLMETVEDTHYREEMQGLMDRAAFSFQQANQKVYVSEGVYTANKQSLAQGNNLLKEGIQMQEATTLTYLKYRYEAQQALKAEKPVPVEVVEEVAPEAPVMPAVVKNTLPRTVVAPKTVKEDPGTLLSEEYRIQFGIFSRFLKEEEVKLPHLSYYKYSENKLYKYFSGSFETPMEAAMGLEEVKAKGFEDAFVVKFVNGKLEK